MRCSAARYRWCGRTYLGERKNWEFAQEAPQIFWLGGVIIAQRARRDEQDEKCGAKPTPEKTNFCVHSSIQKLFKLLKSRSFLIIGILFQWRYL
jgi:hypothetical protein